MPHQYQPLSVRNEIKRTVEAGEKMLSNPLAAARISNRDKVKKDIEKNKKMLEQMTPPTLTGEHLQRAVARRDQLKEAYQNGKEGTVDPNPSEQDMQNPSTGSVGAFVRHQNFWKRNTLDSAGNIAPAERGKGLINELKDLERTIHKDEEEDDPDAANLEKYRCRTRRPPLAESVVPQTFGLSPQARANYDQAFPDHKPTAMEAKLEAAKLVCMGTKNNGDPCQASRLEGTNYCRHHQGQGVIPAVINEPALQQTA